MSRGAGGATLTEELVAVALDGYDEQRDAPAAARALFAGAPNIERVDRLVQSIGVQKGMRNAIVDATVALVDDRLASNRKAAA